MANNINIATFDFDITKLEENLEKLQGSLFDVRKEQERYAKQSKALQKSYSDLEKAQIELIKRKQQESSEYKNNAKAIEKIVTEQKKVFLSQKDLSIQQSKINSEYNATVKIYKDLSGANNEYLDTTDRLEKALESEVKSLNAAKANNKELRTIRDQINTSTDAGRKAIEEINKKLDENTDFIKNNVSAFEKQKMAIGDYSGQIKEAFKEINIFNGGISGFIARSQEAGGSGKLLTQSFKGITTGIWGMIKAGLAFIATPIGITIAAIAISIGAVIKSLKFMDSQMSKTEEGQAKLNKTYAAFSGIMKVLSDVLKPLAEFIFNRLVKNLELLGTTADKVASTLSKSLKYLGFDNAAKSVENYSNEVKKSIENSRNLAEAENKLTQAQRQAKIIQLDYQKQAEKLRQTRDNDKLSIEERIAANQKLGDSLKKQMALELDIAKQALKVADLRVIADKASTEALNKRSEAQAAVLEIEERITGQESEQLINRNALQKEALDLLITRNKQELDNYVALQGGKARTLQQGLDLSKSIAQKETDILKKQLQNRQITQLEYDTALLNIKNDLAKKEAELVADNAKRDLDNFIKNNKSKLEDTRRLSLELVQEEKQRLDLINSERNNLEKIRFEQGLINQQEYQDNLLAIKEESLNKEKELDKTYAAVKSEDDATRRALEFQKRINDLEEQNAVLFEKERADLDFQYQENQIRLEEQRQQGLIDEENYQLALKNIKQEYSNQKRAIDELEFNNTLELASQTYGNLADIAGKESEAGKAFASAQALIDTQQAAIAAYKSLAGIPVVGPALGVAAAAAAIKSGMDNVKKINEVKTPDMPKAEKGIMFNIGGKRHSSGGTKFVGEDGTRFEAEKGEKLFVLNRKASAVIGPLLSGINQSYGGISFSKSSSYLENGGMVASSSKVVQNSFSNINNEQFMQSVSEAVKKGAYAGALSGSSQGTNSGFVALSNNRSITNTSFY